MPQKYPFEYIVDENFFKANQRKETVMLIVNDNETHIVHLEGYTKLGSGLYRLLGSNPPPGKENYTAILRIGRKM
ncbi:MAG: hypothetical protein LBD82_07130 [Deltaproteobacteria bacterium]|jgi:hypothetical protein|nr:hypothetical protein [Deltaproteobacteria bacterium]